jgi:hypothetical protein
MSHRKGVEFAQERKKKVIPVFLCHLSALACNVIKLSVL